jgi:iron complex outermembrane receptor protein
VNFASDVSAEAVALPTVAVDPPKRQTPRRPQPRKAAKKKAAPLVAAPRQAEPVPYLTPSTGTLGAPPPPYAGGQVASGGRLGMLGNRSVMDTPFNQTSYTAKLIQDQQARTLGDVVMNDPSVRLVSNAGSNFDVYQIRGFYSENGDASMNGLYGMVPYYSTAVNYVERVEILKGPSALLNGMPPAGAIGGSINLVTKQAPDDPITQLTTTYQSKAHIGALVDIARRFGENKEWGARFNGSYRNGKTAFDNQTDEFGNAVLNLDYRGESVRFSADMGYQADNLTVPQRFITMSPTLTSVPPPPPAGSTYGIPSWAYWKPKSTFAMVQGEIDIAEKITAYGALGWHRTEISFLYPSVGVDNFNGVLGNWRGRAFQGETTWDTRAGQGGVRADVDTGPVNHFLNVNLSQVSRPSFDDFLASPLNGLVSNLYNPVVLPLPTITPATKTWADRTLSSAGFSDTMSILNKRVQVTVGARHQTVYTSTTTTVVPLNSTTVSTFEESTWSPAYAVVVKPLENVSLYANYIEGLQPGQVVGATFGNGGTILPNYHSKQKEAGIKVDFGRVTTTVAAFEITRPSTVTVGALPTSNQRVLPDGEQVNRGIEINAFGEIAPTFRILGGVAFIDGKLTKTANGTNDGHTAPGVAEINLNVGAEWDTWFVPGLTVHGRVIYTSDQYINAANSLSIPEWTRLDLGARYTLTSPWNGKPIVIRFAVENVFDKAYWNQNYTSDNVVTVGAPRTFLASSTFNF